MLFLDELPEFGHALLESLRQPLEDKTVTITRVSGTVTYPASFMLVAAMNPCPCGYATHPRKQCVCSPSAVARYQRRISGPLLERIDIFVEVPPVEYDSLLAQATAEPSASVRERVLAARAIQERRFASDDETAALSNAEMAGRKSGSTARCRMTPRPCCNARRKPWTCRRGRCTGWSRLPKR